MCRSRKLRNRSGSSTTCSYSCREQERQIVFRPRTTLVGRSATGRRSSRLKLSPDDRQRHQHSRATAQFTWTSGALPEIRDKQRFWGRITVALSPAEFVVLQGSIGDNTGSSVIP